MEELNGKTNDELVELVRTKQEELRQTRFSAAGSRTRNTKAARNLRKEIARIKTILRQRELVRA